MNGSALRELRERFGFTQDELSTVLGISVQAVRRIELAESVDQVTVAKYERSVAYLRGLLRGMARRLTRAMREEIAAV